MRCADPVANATATTSPLTKQLADRIGQDWLRGAGFAAIADDLVDIVAEHIRGSAPSAVDPRLAHAIADVVSAHVDRDAPRIEVDGQLTIADVIACKACRDARRTAERGWCAVCDGAWPIDDRAVTL